MYSINVDKAMNGQEAVDLYTKDLKKRCCNKRYKLVLMDLNMPIMDGYEATIQILETMRKHNLTQTKKQKCDIVAITAYVNEENVKKCYKVGMMEVLHKPVNCDALRIILDKYYHKNN